ncbi:MAG: response regulator [Blastochloris sp.]|nr:response regulator [Blastochloris sp.]
MQTHSEEQARLKEFKKLFKGKPILLVDDDPHWIKAMHMLLDTLGASVNCAPNGEKAVQYLRLARYDIILLDIQMPGIDGWDLYAIMQQVRPGRDLPVYFLTGLPAPLQTKFVAKLPVSPERVLQKSLSPWEILATISKELLEPEQAA